MKTVLTGRTLDLANIFPFSCKIFIRIHCHFAGILPLVFPPFPHFLFTVTTVQNTLTDRSGIECRSSDMKTQMTRTLLVSGSWGNDTVTRSGEAKIVATTVSIRYRNGPLRTTTTSKKFESRKDLSHITLSHVTTNMSRVT